MPAKRATLMDPPIEELLDKVDSKFTLVTLGAKRAREINAYYHGLGEVLGQVIPPQVTTEPDPADWEEPVRTSTEPPNPIPLVLPASR